MTHSPERISKAILVAGVALIVAMLLSCKKEDAIPNCQRVYYFCNHYDGYKRYTYSDTLDPFFGNNIICQPELQKEINYIPELQGCESLGYEMRQNSIGVMRNEIKYLK